MSCAVFNEKAMEKEWMKNQTRTNEDLLKEISALKKKMEKLEKVKTAHRSSETALRECENRYRQMEERYRCILEDMEEAYYEVDLKGNLSFFNDTAISNLGYDEDATMGMNYRHYMDEENARKLGETYNRVFLTGKPVKHLEWEITGKNDTIIPVESSVSLVRDMHGNPVGFRGVIRDITDRKKAQDERLKLASIVRYSSEIIFLADIEGRVVFFNETCARMLGIDPEKAGEVKIQDIVSEDFHPTVRSEILPAMLSGGTWEGELRYRNVQTGAQMDVYVMALTIASFAHHTPYYIASIARDITEQKKAVRSLRHSEENYRSIFENAQEGIFRSTPEGKFIVANSAMARILGYDSPEELIRSIDGIDRQLYVRPHEHARNLELIKRHDQVLNDEIQLYRKDGRKIWVHLAMRAIRDGKGRLMFLDGLVGDLTDRKENIAKLRKALGGTVQAIASLVEARDPYTAGHQRRVADLARAIAGEMSLSSEIIDGIRLAGTIHDIGKVSIPAEILSSPRKLSELEFSLIKTHAQSGYEIIKDVEFPWPIARIILEHHERVNGTGYPNGLSGGDILLESRILAVADVVEAMATHRPYRPSLGLDKALEEINRNRGTLYDSDAVNACLRLFHEKGYCIKE